VKYVKTQQLMVKYSNIITQPVPLRVMSFAVQFTALYYRWVVTTLCQVFAFASSLLFEAMPPTQPTLSRLIVINLVSYYTRWWMTDQMA